ncbi:MAG: NAD(+)/NADH kinase [Agathobacter sp.]|nr:NAD(+)/NADH kinase [Agathobacter sp.]
MRKFMLITNFYKDRDLALSKRIAGYIREKGGTVGICTNNMDEGDGQVFDLSEIPRDTECILVLGGDGTLIRAATGTQELQIPLIGVNMGTLGYLCELEEATVFDALDQLFQDNYTTEERIMLSAAKVGDGEDARLALNDIVIHWTEFMSLLRLYVYVNGKPLNTYEADGILVATPTGSTGYNISAGGPIVEPKARMLLLTPINAHDLNARSIVLGDEDVIEIEIGTRRYQADEKACVSFDGDTVMQLQVGDKVRITRASNSIRICKLNNQSFLEILRKKMQR